MARREATGSNGGEPNKKSYSEVIDELSLTPLQKDAMRARWLDQRNYSAKDSVFNKNWHQRLRLLAIVGGVIVPALVALNVEGSAVEAIRWTVFVISLIVAISVAVEEFFGFGEKWMRSRRTNELLKTEFWQFVQRAGHYEELGTHRQSFDEFASRVEQIIRLENRTFFTNEMARQGQGQDGQPAAARTDSEFSFAIEEAAEEEEAADATEEEGVGADLAFGLEPEAEAEEAADVSEDE